jgi:hypothetical protein
MQESLPCHSERREVPETSEANLCIRFLPCHSERREESGFSRSLRSLRMTASHFGVRYSMFIIRCSLFDVHYSMFIIRCLYSPVPSPLSPVPCPYCVITLNSTRLFFFRPASVALSANGCSEPLPDANNRLLAIPLRTM